MTEVVLPGCPVCIAKNEPHAWHEDSIFISHACQFPIDHQADILPWNENAIYTRHPWDDSRPEWSGYCLVTDACRCTCHEGDDVMIMEFDPEEGEGNRGTQP